MTLLDQEKIRAMVRKFYLTLKYIGLTLHIDLNFFITIFQIYNVFKTCIIFQTISVTSDLFFMPFGKYLEKLNQKYM